jgi:hypothetical protein
MTPQKWFDIAVLALLLPLNIRGLCDSATQAARRKVLDAHQQTLDAQQEALAATKRPSSITGAAATAARR